MLGVSLSPSPRILERSERSSSSFRCELKLQGDAGSLWPGRRASRQEGRQAGRRGRQRRQVPVLVPVG